MTLASWLPSVLVLALHAPPTPGETHVERAEHAYTQGHYAEAADAFADAFAEDPRPRYLYAQAQAERLADNCKGAVELYEAFLEISDDADAIAAAKTNRDRCEEEMTTPRPPPPPPVIVAPPADPQPPADAHEPRQPRWYQDRLGAALVGSGGGLVAAGAVLSTLASGRSDRARQASDEGAFESQLSSAKRLNATGIALIGVGASAVVAGVIRWALVSRR